MEKTNHARLVIYHANPKGTGTAMRLELHPAHGETDGSVRIVLAPQRSASGARTTPIPPPTFDWENTLRVKLDFTDLSKVLQVLRGECESVDEGRGIVHQTATALTRISFRHLVDPIPGYSLETERIARGGGESVRAAIFFGSAEACGLAEAFAAAIPLVAFGVPEADA